MAGLIDRMVAAVSPAAGARRMVARQTMERVAAISAAMPVSPGGKISGPGGYVGGQNTRATRKLKAKARGANQDMAKLQTLTARSAYAAMNYPLATALVERRVTFTVGTGMMAIPQIDGKRLGLDQDEAALLTATIMRDYDRYMASTDPDVERVATGYEQQAIILRGKLVRGDVLGLRCMPKLTEQPGRAHRMAWKLIEGDRILSPDNHTDGEPLGGKGPVVVHGVELDGYGAATAYHVLAKAPTSAMSSRQANDTVRIPAWGDQTGLPSALLVMGKDRPEQARGIPMLAPVIDLLVTISSLTEAEAWAAAMSSMIAIVYTSPDAAELPQADYGNGEIVQAEAMPETLGTAQSEYNLDVGTVLELDQDSKVDAGPLGRPNPNYEPFFKALAQQLGAATGTPVEVVLLAFQSSYTASKAAIECYYTEIAPERESLGSKWCDPHYRAWLFEQVAKGRYPQINGFFDDPLRRELWSDVRHRGDGKISLNPQQEMKAFEVAEAHGWLTGSEIAALLFGGDYDSNVKTRIGEHERWVAGGLPVPGAKGGGAAPASDHAAPGEGDDNGEQTDGQ